MTDGPSNIIPFRPTARGEPHSYEVVEIMRYSMAGPEELWVSLGGPYIAPAGSLKGGRKPWHHVATFPASDVDAAIGFARELATDFSIRMVNLAGVVSASDNATREV